LKEFIEVKDNYEYSCKDIVKSVLSKMRGTDQEGREISRLSSL
jgi:hypothetical protein